MTINIFLLKGDLNKENRSGAFLFCRVYVIHQITPVDSVYSSFAWVKTGLRIISSIKGQSFINNHLEDVLILF